MKIRWYHWLVYKVFYKVWTPIWKSRPELAIMFRDHLSNWLDQRERDIESTRKGFKVVK